LANGYWLIATLNATDRDLVPRSLPARLYRKMMDVDDIRKKYQMKGRALRGKLLFFFL
jgi:hypothetical protein